MRMCTGNRGLTRAELGIRLCSSSCKGMARQIPAAPPPFLTRRWGDPKHHHESPPSPQGGAVPAPLKLGSAATAGCPCTPPLTSTLRKPPRRRT